ncbi:MAG: hypothetical protein FWG27_07580 [Treponema sp.]|nr:hypothetical protein [Treponema sp.]
MIQIPDTSLLAAPEQAKSKRRIADFCEVYTSAREVTGHWKIIFLNAETASIVF